MTPADIVIVNHNTRDDLVACLASVTAPDARPPGEIVVVDNASGDGSVAAVRDAFPQVTLIALDRNAGFGAANNVAMRRSTAPLVLLLNSDAVVSPSSIPTLIERLEARGATAAGPRLADATGRPEVSFGSMLTPWGELRQRRLVRMANAPGGWRRRRIERLLDAERWVDWVSGACLLVRRDAALGAGLFDERFFLYEEDVDFCAALRARGGRVLYTPASRVVHHRGRSGAAGPASRAHYDRSHLAFYEKHAPAWAPALRLWLRLRGRTIQ